MSHNVLVGGFASSERQMKKVAGVLAERCDEEFEAISFREAMTNPDRLERLARGANVLTHSAGMLALRGTSPESIDAIAPPIPVCAPLLAARAIASGAEFIVSDVRKCAEDKDVDGCVGDVAAELGLHLRGNLCWLGSIASFDALKTAAAAEEAGIPTGVAFMTNDKLFRPRPRQLLWARRQGLHVVSIAGVHEDFVQNPCRVMNEYEMGLGITPVLEMAPEPTAGLSPVLKRSLS